MSLASLLLAATDPGVWIAFATIGVVFVLFIVVIVIAKRYVKVGPNQVLVISGRGRRTTQGRVGFRIVKGGGAFILPVVEKYDLLSLEIMTIDIKTPEVYTVTGVPVIVDGVAQIKVKGDDVSISTAAEQFLSMDRARIAEIAHQTLEGHLRAILGMMTVEEIYKNRDAFAQRVQEISSADMANMGLTIISFTLRDIRDNQGYLDALGKPRTAQVKRDAIIAQAEADRDSMIKSSQANQAGQEAKFLADTEIALSQRDYESKRAEYQAAVNLKKAASDLAYDLQKNKTMQEVKAEEVRVIQVEKTQRIEVQEKEILRREKELEATINRPADAERYRIETLANAERFKLETEAKGQADANKARGFADADVVKARGIAEADVILAQGQNEAEAMEKKAAAWKNYNEAAVLQLFFEHAPDLARAISEPLSKTEKIVIIGNGDEGSGAGASRVTKDVTNILAQMPEVVETLTGMDLNAALKRVAKLGDSTDTSEQKGDAIKKPRTEK